MIPGLFLGVLMGRGSIGIGRSGPRGEHVVDRPISERDVVAAIDPDLEIDDRFVAFEDPNGRPGDLIEQGEPNRDLVG